MSQKTLRDFLVKLDRELQDDKGYARATSDIKTHIFKLNRNQLINEVLFEIASSGRKLTKLRKRTVIEYTNGFFEELKAGLEVEASVWKGLAIVHSKGDRDNILIEVYSFINKEGNNANVFNSYFYKVKTKAQGKFYRQIDALFKISRRTVEGKAPPREIGFDITHEEDTAVAIQQISSTKSQLDTAPIVANSKEFLQANEINLSIEKFDKKETIVISLGSKFKNRGMDATGEKAALARTKRSLEQAIYKLGFLDLKGSDSFIDRTKKKILNIVKKAFSKVKGASFKFENTKFEESTSGKTTLNIKQKVVNTGTTKLNTLDRFPSAKEAPAPNINLQLLVPVINESLAETIQRKMGSPRLNYRSGRFAKSASVLDVRRGRDGVVDIGYTYMLYPYKVFEHPPTSAKGAILATPQRDPRLVIGESIREIASAHLKEHFNTTRY